MRVVSGTRPDERILWAAVALAFAPAVLALASIWSSVDYYQHGFLVPVVSLATAWGRIPGLGPSQRRSGFLVGLAVVMPVYGLALVLDSPTLLGLCLVAALACLAGFRWGGSGLRRLAFPLAFLLFMVPLPPTWVTPLVVELQLLASRGAESVLHAIGIDVFREGNVIMLPGGQSLFVDEACSGITSLLSLIPIGVLLARFTQPPGWRRFALVAAVIPAALLCNALRVIATVAAADAWGVERATSGSLHDLAGLITSAGAVVLVVALGALLTRALGAGERAPA